MRNVKPVYSAETLRRLESMALVGTAVEVFSELAPGTHVPQGTAMDEPDNSEFLDFSAYTAEQLNALVPGLTEQDLEAARDILDAWLDGRGKGGSMPAVAGQVFRFLEARLAGRKASSS